VPPAFLGIVDGTDVPKEGQLFVVVREEAHDNLGDFQGLKVVREGPGEFLGETLEPALMSR
jgi:hypothetical protein